MSNVSVPAAAEGMPAAIFNRRRLLLGLAAASTAAATPASALVGPAENPALLALADALPALVSEYRAATEARSAILSEWAPKWPRAPEGIVYWDDILCGELERDLTGTGYNYEAPAGTPPRRMHRRIYRADDLGRGVEMWTASLRRSRNTSSRARAQERIDEYARPLALAEPYEAECAGIREASGYETANDRLENAEAALASHASKILSESPETMAGVLIQAQALEAMSGLDPLSRAAFQARKKMDWGGALAASILRLSGATA